MANSAVVGILRALLTASTAEFETAMKRSADSAKVFSRDMKKVGTQATQIGASLTKVLTVPIIGLGGSVAKMAADFESSFAGVRKTVDATEPEFAAMADAFRELSRTIPVNVNDLNRLGEAAGALGIPKEEIVDFSRVMALLGVTTNVTADQAATAIAQIQNQFNAGGQDTERFASTLVALGNAGASTEQDILALATRIASAGVAVGLSQGEVLGFSAAIANVGMEAEAGGSALTRVFRDIQMAVSEGGSAVSGFAAVAGLSIEEFSRLFREDAAQAVLKFTEGLGRVQTSGGDLIGTLNDLGFTELRQSDLLRRLALSGDNLRNSLNLQNEAWVKNSALSEEARKRFETVHSQLTLLWNRVKDVGITIGNALLPVIESTVGTVNTLIPVVEALAKGFTGLPVPVQAIAVGFVAVAAAAGPMLLLFGQLAFAASSVVAAFTAKGLATTALTGALAGLTAQIPTVTAAATTMASVFTLSATHAAALSLTLSGLAAAAGVAAAAFAGWNLGKWIGEITGATYAVEYLAGRLMGLSPEHIRASSEARKHAEAVQDFSKALEALAARDIAKFKNATEEARQKAKDLAEALPAAEKQVTLLADATAKLAAEAHLTPSALKEIGRQAAALQAQGVTLPPILRNIVDALERMRPAAKQAGDGLVDLGEGSADTSQQAVDLGKALREARVQIDALQGSAREDLVRALRSGAFSMEELEKATSLSRTAIKLFEDSLTAADKATEKAAETQQQFAEALEDARARELDMGRQALQTSESMRELGQTALASGGIIADAFQMAQMKMAGFVTQVKELPKFDLSDFFKMGTIKPPDLSQFKNTLTTTFAGAFSKLPDLLIKSFTGGGGIKGAMQAVGTLIGDGLFGERGALAGATRAASGGLTKVFGQSIGGALAAAIPGVGALIGPAPTSLWSGIKKIFGGPSEKELEGRDIKKAFQESFGGFEEMLGTISDAYLATGRSAEMARQDVERLLDAEKKGGEAVKKVIGDISKAFDEQKSRWEGVQESVGNLNAFVKEGIDTQGKYNLAAASAVAIFDAWVQKTGDVAGALQQLGPTLDGLVMAEQTLGFTGNAAIEQLLRLREVTEAHAPLMENIGQSTMLMTSLGKAGLLTNELIIGFGQNAVNHFKILKEATGDAKQAMVLMQPELQALWEHQQKFGKFADEATQALVDQAEQNGIVGPHMKSINEQIRDVMIEIRDVLLDATGQTRKLGDEIDKLPTQKRLRYKIDYDEGERPRPPGAATGGLVTAFGIQRFASGGLTMPRMGTDTVHAMLTPGELILNEDQQHVVGTLVAKGLSGGANVDVSGVESRLESLLQEQRRSRTDLQRLMDVLPIHLRAAVQLAQ